MKHIFFIIVFVVSSALSLSAQDISNKAEKLLKEANEHLAWGRTDAAILLLEKVTNIEPEYIKGYKKLTYAYMKIKDYEGAQATLLRLIVSINKIEPEIFFQLAKVSFAAQDYSKTDKYIQLYRENVGKISPKRLAESEKIQRDLDFAEAAIKHPVNYNPVALDSTINTPLREYYPTLTADGKTIYFTRQSKNATGTFQEDIMQSKLINGKWSMPLSIFNQKHSQANEGAQSISPDGQAIYFTKCESQGGYGGCDIYVSYRQGYQWGPPFNLGPNINSSVKETQPCISSDGNSLYFVSSRDGGFGKLDIWVSHRNFDGHWGKAHNLGPSINTPYIDEKPYIHPDNTTLYFASNGHPGFGNLDLYMSTKSAEGWAKPINLGYPINTYEDESGIYVNLDGNKAYFSAQKEKRSYDLNIYYFELPENVRPTNTLYVTGKITNIKNGNPIEALVEFIDLETGKVFNRVYSSLFKGDYLLCLPSGKDYSMFVSAKGYMFNSTTFYLSHEKDKKEQLVNLSLRPIAKGETTSFDNLHFESGGANLSPTADSILNRIYYFLEDNPSVSIEISGHTDDVGSTTSNQKLSENRAKTVYNYLIAKGIKEDRLQFIGYGESKAKFDNITEEGRQKNRRTEITIL